MQVRRMGGFLSGRRWADISVRKKLFVPVVVQFVVLILFTLILLNGLRLLAEARDRAAAVSELMGELYLLGAEIEGFIADRILWQDVDAHVDHLREHLQDTGITQLYSDLTELKSALSQYHTTKALQRSIISEVRTLTSSSRELSNAYIVRVSERLAHEEERALVTTIERAVIPGALKNTVNNFAIEDMFISLSRGDRTPDEAIGLLDATIGNTRADIIRLAGTPFVKKAEAGLVVNLRLREMLVQYLEALTTSAGARSRAVQLHTELMQKIDALSRDALLGTLDRLGQGIWILLLVFVGVVGISLLLSVLVSISISRPLSELRAHIDQLAASGGNLSFRLRSDRNDELGLLARGVNEFLHSLQSIFSEVRASGHEMADASRHFADVARDCSQQMLAQQDKTQGVVRSAAEITSGVDLAHDRSGAAAQAVEMSETRVVDVARSIQDTIKIINIANIELENASSVIGKLNVDSQNIGGILDVVRGIADQTNLLALNAAIEAARAGDLGRGFAVVADEVRSLAHRTQSSLDEIDKMISNLQNASTLATCVVAGSAESISSTLASAQAAGDGVQIIADCISDIATLNAEVASMMDNQLEQARDIDRVVQDIGAIADRSAIAVRDASQSAEMQVGRAEKLVSLMARFSGS